jgi:hypothetical protein
VGLGDKAEPALQLFNQLPQPPVLLLQLKHQPATLHALIRGVLPLYPALLRRQWRTLLVLLIPLKDWFFLKLVNLYKAVLLPELYLLLILHPFLVEGQQLPIQSVELLMQKHFGVSGIAHHFIVFYLLV